HSVKFSIAPGNIVPRGPEPPPNGTAVSLVPLNWISEIGRAGLQLPHDGLAAAPVTQSKSTGATAAITPAASHATLNAMPPPFEHPEAYTRFGSMHASFCSVVMMARVNAMSSTFSLCAVLQH